MSTKMNLKSLVVEGFIKIFNEELCRTNSITRRI